MKLGIIGIEMTLDTFGLPVAKARTVVYRENSKGPKTEPLGIPSKTLRRSDKVESIFYQRTTVT